MKQETRLFFFWPYVPVPSQEPVVQWLSLFASLLLFVLRCLTRLVWWFYFMNVDIFCIFGAFYSLLWGMDPCPLLKAVTWPVEVKFLFCLLTQMHGVWLSHWQSYHISHFFIVINSCIYNLCFNMPRADRPNVRQNSRANKYEQTR